MPRENHLNAIYTMTRPMVKMHQDLKEEADRIKTYIEENVQDMDSGEKYEIMKVLYHDALGILTTDIAALFGEHPRSIVREFGHQAVVCPRCRGKRRIPRKRGTDNTPEIVCNRCEHNMWVEIHGEEEEEEEEEKNADDDPTEEDTEEPQNFKAMPYQEYLQTDWWKECRKLALRRAKWRCQTCNGNTNLHVHHRTYDNLGHEDPGDLFVLCSACHEKIHGIEGSAA